jgi:hypothetical protein
VDNNVLGQDPASEVGSSKKTWASVLLVVLIGVVIAITFASFYLQQKASNNQPAGKSYDELQADIQAQLLEAESRPFVYTVVPNALEAITVPPPPDSDATDKAAYESAHAQVGNISAEDARNDLYYTLTFKDMTYGEFQNSLVDPSLLFQIHDELRNLTLHFNQLYNRPPLAERVEGVSQMFALDPVIYNNPTPSVYPSVRAVDAYIAAEIMSVVDPANAAQHRQQAEALVVRGIGYGIYGASDAQTAKEMVAQYVALIPKDTLR